jgi:phosphoribosylformylglycinamidine cyclo-ligase
MPGMYAPGDFDLAGFAVGAVERDRVLPKPEHMRAGDVLIGIASSGLHSNGFSLVRKLLTDAGIRLDTPAPFGQNKSMAEILLTPTRLYVQGTLAATRSESAKGFAHITGGGITENLPRILPAHLQAQIDLAAWTAPAVFRWLSKTGGVSEPEMLRTFNCGIGLIAVAAEESASTCIDAFVSAGDHASVIGGLAASDGDSRVQYKGGGLFA